MENWIQLRLEISTMTRHEPNNIRSDSLANSSLAGHKLFSTPCLIGHMTNEQGDAEV